VYPSQKGCSRGIGEELILFTTRYATMGEVSFLA
jgi:hypothetical protein